MALAIDHRMQLEAMADEVGAPRRAHRRLQGAGRRGRGARGRRPARLRHAARRHLWPRGAVPRRRPSVLDRPPGRAAGLAAARFRGRRQTSARKLVEWPVGHTIKCLCFYHPDDPAELKQRQERELLRLYDAARKHRPRTAGRDHRRQARAARTTTRSRGVVQRLYALGIKPDWWKLEPQTDEAAWRAIGDVIREERPLLPRHRAARARGAGGRAGGGLRRRRQRAAGQGLRGRPHDLQRRGPALAQGRDHRRGGDRRHGRAISASGRIAGSVSRTIHKPSSAGIADVLYRDRYPISRASDCAWRRTGRRASRGTAGAASPRSPRHRRRRVPMSAFASISCIFSGIRGALIVMGAMGLFSTLAFEQMGGPALTITASDLRGAVHRRRPLSVASRGRCRRPAVS